MKRASVLAAFLATGCALAPPYERPVAPVPISWPVGDAYLKANEAALPFVDAAAIFVDPRVQRLLAIAADNNRDLRIAAANVVAARAAYRIQRAEQLPLVGAGAGVNRTDDGAGQATRLSASVGVTAFELDLFGRLASLTRAQQELYLASEAGARATRIALTGAIVDAWATYAADAELLRIAEETVRIAERSVTLTQARLRGGVAPRTDLRQAQQVLETARADAAQQRTALAQDVNALQLLIGAPVPADVLPRDSVALDSAVLTPTPGLDSQILLRRPDVLQAEYRLRAANADIGAARAALFPRISLTGVLGFASNALSSLFDGGRLTTQTGANADYPIFAGGAARAGVEQAEAQRAAALAQYELAIQNAFREAADALARLGTIEDQLAANRRLVVAARDTQRLTEARYRGGVASFLESLDAQRSAYVAERTLTATRLARILNRTALYRALAVESSAPNQALP